MARKRKFGGRRSINHVVTKWIVVLFLVLSATDEWPHFLDILRPSATDPRPGLFASSAKVLCIPGCDCDPVQRKATCSGADLKSIPITLNPNLLMLELNDNRINENSLRYRSLYVYPDLRRLDLGANGIHELPEKCFERQNKLQILKLDGNRISRLAPDSLFGLISLEILQINGNVLQNITSPSPLKRLNHLKTLDLTRNQISYIASDAFDELKTLRHLYLRANRLGQAVESPDIDLPALEELLLEDRLRSDEGGHHHHPVLVLSLPALSPKSLPHLLRLDLGKNLFAQIVRKWSPFAKTDRTHQPSYGHPNERRPRRAFTRGTSVAPPLSPDPWETLEELYLDGCFIESIEPGSFDGLTALLILRLHDNSLREVPTLLFNDLASLEVLQIGNNHFTEIEAEAFFPLKALKSLDLSSCPYLETIHSGAFKSNDNLERLDLSSNPGLAYLETDVFEGLDNLKYLSLRGNNLTTIDLKLLPIGIHSEASLEVLDIRDNPLECNCSLELVRELLVRLRNESLIPSDQYITQEEGEDGEGGESELSEKGWHYSERLVLRLPEQSSSTAASSGSPSDAAENISHSSSAASSGSPSSLSSSWRSFIVSVTEVTCEGPESLSGQLLIDLNPESIGCIASDLRIMITVSVICLITAGLVVGLAMRFRSSLPRICQDMNCKAGHTRRGSPAKSLRPQRQDFAVVHKVYGINIESNIVEKMGSSEGINPSAPDWEVRAPLRGIPSTDL